MTKKNYLALFAKSFNWAGFFLPKNIYHDCSKLYAFCRVLDDLVDETAGKPAPPFGNLTTIAYFMELCGVSWNNLLIAHNWRKKNNKTSKLVFDKI